MTVKKSRTRERQKSLNSGELVTKQSEVARTNINSIMAKYQKTGHIPQVTATPMYGDVSQAPAYQAACEIVAKAKQQFDALPAQIRDYFKNDPANMLEFVNNPDNKDKMIELGLAKKSDFIVEEPVVTETVTENATESVAETVTETVATSEATAEPAQ